VAEHSRLFLALWPTDETRQTLVRVSQALQVGGCKPVRSENFHVTLVFLGHVDTVIESLIKQRVADIAAQPFTMIFDGLGYWPQPKVICLTCQHPAQELVRLVAALDSAVTSCGLATDPRPYIPHITLSKQARQLPDSVFERVIWRAESFCLVESRRVQDYVRYEVIQEWPFRLKPGQSY